MLAKSKVIHPSITLDKAEGTVEEDGTLTLTATTKPLDAEVTWSSSDDNVASVNDGVVTGEAAGTATITASITVDGVDYTATCAVTVTAAPEPLAVSPTELTIVKGETGTATVTGGSGEYTASTTTANISATVGEGGVVTVTTNASSAASDTVTISDGTDTVTIAVSTTAAQEEPTT